MKNSQPLISPSIRNLCSQVYLPHNQTCEKIGLPPSTTQDVCLPDREGGSPEVVAVDQNDLFGSQKVFEVGKTGHL
jgi:hypothetical protein